MKHYEIYINGRLDGYTVGKSVRSIEMRLRRLGYKTSTVDIVELY